MNDTKLKLTDRDLEILRLLGQGCTSAQIAEMLSLSPETIKWYRKRLLTKNQPQTKMGAESRMYQVEASKSDVQ